MLLIEKNIFSSEECSEIIKMNLQNAKVWYAGDRSYTSFDFFYNEENTWVYDRFSKFFINETGIKIKELKKNIHFHKYVEGDKFDLHNDDMRERVYGVGLVLNNEFEGGDFIFYNPEKIVLSKEVGNAYIFDVRINHQIKVISSGIRYSMLWFLGKNNLEFEKNNLI